MINKNAPFPQANDFEKVIAVLNVNDEKDLKDYDVMMILLGDVNARQVDYYESACKYLGLLDDNKAFTSLGNQLRKITGVKQKAYLAQIIVSDEVFGTVFFLQKMLGVELEIDDVISIMKSKVSFESECMYRRRASTVQRWVKWICDNESK